MPFLLATKRRAGTQAVVTGNAANQQRYTNLKSTFAEGNQYRLFAEPAETARDISWYTDWEPDPAVPPMTLGELDARDPARADEVRGRVASAMDAFFRKIKQYEHDPRHYDRLKQVLADSFELPEADTNVWILTDTDGQERYVLTQWGHINDAFDPDRRIIDRWNRFARRAIRVQVRLAWNRQPAPDESFFVADTGQPPRTDTVCTDAAGVFVLPAVRPGFPLTYWQTDSDGKTYNRGTLLPDETRETYEILLDRWLMATLLVQQNGQPKPGERVTITVDGPEVDRQLVSDAQGRVVLVGLKAGTTVRVRQQTDGLVPHEQHYRVDPDQCALLFTLPDTVVVPPPPPVLADTTVILRDRAGKPVAGGAVRFGWAGSQLARTLDQRGATRLAQVAPGQTVTVVYQANPAGQQTTWQGQFTRLAGQDEYVLTMTRRWAWWWWLLGALLLLALLCLLKLLPICPYCCASEPAPAPTPRVIHDTIRDVIRDTIVRTDTVHVGSRVLHRGDITLTMTWETTDDLDLYLETPDGQSINYRRTNRNYPAGDNGMTGKLEIDANGIDGILRHPVEHIYCVNPIPGAYRVLVQYYNQRTYEGRMPFTVSVQVGPETRTFSYTRANFDRAGERSEPLLVQAFTYPGPTP